MMKILTKLFAVSILTAAGTVSAIPVTGSIGFGGAFSHNGTSNFSDATQINVTSAVVTGVVSGDFLAAGIVAGDSASYSNFTFAPVGFVDDLWHIGDFAFDLTSMVNVHQDANFLILSGSGTITAPGFEATQGDWGFTANNFGSSFTWSDSNAAVSYLNPSVSVPEPAISLLLGAGLLGISFARRMRKAA